MATLWLNRPIIHAPQLCVTISPMDISTLSSKDILQINFKHNPPLYPPQTFSPLPRPPLISWITWVIGKRTVIKLFESLSLHFQQTEPDEAAEITSRQSPKQTRWCSLPSKSHSQNSRYLVRKEVLVRQSRLGSHKACESMCILYLVFVSSSQLISHI